MEQLYEMEAGALEPVFRGQYTERRGTEPNFYYVRLSLAGKTVKLRITKPAGELVKTATVVNPDAAPDDPDYGAFECAWAAGDMDVVGTFPARLSFYDTATGGLLFSTPRFYFSVT